MGIVLDVSPISESERSTILRFQSSPPIDVTGIADAFGINVWESSKLGPEVSGMLFKDQHFGGKSGYSISVRAQDPYVRKRFTIAHEIAHYLLHRQQFGEGLSDDQFYRSGLSGAQEAEANKLATDILLPLHLIQALIGSGTNDVSVLATMFQVSPAAMMIRLGIPIP
jgi:uncharacterized protein DUF955